MDKSKGGLELRRGGRYYAMVWNNLIVNENKRVRKEDDTSKRTSGIRSNLREKVLEHETDENGSGVCTNCGEKTPRGVLFIWNEDISPLLWKVRKKVGIQYYCRECIMETEKHKEDKWENVIDEGREMR